MPSWSDVDQDVNRPKPYPWDEYVSKSLSRWHQLLDQDPAERQLQEFLERNPCFLPGGEDRLPIGGITARTTAPYLVNPRSTVLARIAFLTSCGSTARVRHGSRFALRSNALASSGSTRTEHRRRS